MAKYTEKGTLVESLTENERRLLSKKIVYIYNLYKYILFTISASTVLILGLFILIEIVFNYNNYTTLFATIFFINTMLIIWPFAVMRNMQNKLKIIKQNNFKVYELTGILSVDYRYKGMLAYKIDNNRMHGETIIFNSKSKIQDYINQQVTFQYIPELAKNRLFTDQNGKGYNFITDTFID